MANDLREGTATAVPDTAAATAVTSLKTAFGDIRRVGVFVGTFDVAFNALTTGLDWLNKTTRALQMANPPVNLREQYRDGWTGHTQRAYADGSRLQWDTRLTTDGGAITRYDHQSIAGPGGSFERSRTQSTPATNWFERWIFQLRPQGAYYDPATTVTRTVTHERYRIETHSGVTRRTDVPLPPAPHIESPDPRSTDAGRPAPNDSPFPVPTIPHRSPCARSRRPSPPH